MLKKKRTIILIDGSNFYFKLKDLQLHHLIKFNFSNFALSLAKSDEIITVPYGSELLKLAFARKRRFITVYQIKEINI